MWGAERPGRLSEKEFGHERAVKTGAAGNAQPGKAVLHQQMFSPAV